MLNRGIGRHGRRLVTVSAFAVAVLAINAGAAHATLQLLKPNPNVPATFVGKGGYSADGLGQNAVGGTVQAEVPAGSTVVRAYLYGTYFGAATPSLVDRTLDFDGNGVVLDFLTNSEPGPCCALATARAEVTNQVRAKVGGGGGIFDFAINTDPGTLDGVALVVIYANPSSSDGTIAILDGGSKQAGDSTVFPLAGPLDTSIANFGARMSLGSGFSFQGAAGHVCSGGQFSTVSVNTQPLTNCAGNYDDGLANDGALITVGGVGDSLDNPTPPPPAMPTEDDELYNLLPFLHAGDTQIVIDTTNPSGDDNLFLAVIQFSARVAGTVEICDNGADEDGDGLVDAADDDCAATTEACGFKIDGISKDGTDSGDTLSGTDKKDRIKGGPGKDQITGLGDRDCLLGVADSDKIVGDDGDDVIRAGADADKVSGGEGNDDIKLQHGDDKGKGGPGDDHIKAQGRGADKVNCGSGDDKVVADPRDSLSKNCEHVKIVNPH
jgi:Ca2+-binding RTX toxin-like protein